METIYIAVVNENTQSESVCKLLQLEEIVALIFSSYDVCLYVDPLSLFVDNDVLSTIS